MVNNPDREAAFVAIHPVHRRCILLIFGAYGLLVAFLSISNQTVGAEYVIPSLLFVIAIKIAPLILFKSKYGWFHPLVFSSLFWMLELIRSFPIYAFGLDRNLGLPGYRPSELAGLVFLGLLLDGLSQLAYYMGFFTGFVLKVPRLHFSRPHHVSIKSVSMIVLSLLAFSFYLQRQGGIASHLLFLGDGRWNLINQGMLSGEWSVLTRISILGCLIWFTMDQKSLRSPIFWGLTLLSLVSQYLVIGSRASLINMLLLGLMIYMLKQRKLFIGAIVFGAVTSLMLIGILGDLRSDTWKNTVDWNTVLLANPLVSFRDGISELHYRSGIQNPLYPILARVPYEINFLYGKSYLKLLSLPIPRALWPEKPRTTAAMAGEIMVNTMAAVPTGAIGEAYWNFHIPGIIIIFFLFGVWHRWLSDTFLHYSREPAAILLYAYTLFQLTPEVQIITSWVYTFSSLLFCLWLIGAIKLRSKPLRLAG